MKIEITREELQLIRKALDFLKRDNDEIIDDFKESGLYDEAGMYETVKKFEDENMQVDILRGKLAVIVYGERE